MGWSDDAASSTHIGEEGGNLPEIIDIARRNVNSASTSRRAWREPKDLDHLVKLQAAHWRKQVDALTAQAEEVRALSTKVTADAAAPIKTQVARGVDELRKVS